MPGISLITITAGPAPATYTRLPMPSNDIARRAKSSSGSSSVRLRAGMMLSPDIGLRYKHI